MRGNFVPTQITVNFSRNLISFGIWSSYRSELRFWSSAMWCRVVWWDRYQSVTGTWCFHVQSRKLRQQVPQKRSYLFTKLHGVTVFLVVTFLLAFPPIFYMLPLLPHSCYMPCPSHPPWCDHSNLIFSFVNCRSLNVWSKSYRLCIVFEKVDTFLFDHQLD
jgi:hypothetical protein